MLYKQRAIKDQQEESINHVTKTNGFKSRFARVLLCLSDGVSHDYHHDPELRS